MKAQDLTELLESGEKTPDSFSPMIYTVTSVLLANRKTSISSSRQSKKCQNIHPVTTASEKCPKHPSYRHGNRKKPQTSILSSRQPKNAQNFLWM